LWFVAPGVDTRLPDAAMRGDRQQVQSLLKENVDVNSAQGDGHTALHWAAYRDDIDMARLLIRSSAKVDARTRVGDITPLLLAAKNGSAAMIEVLVNAGAEVNALNANGTTPLMLAAASGKTAALTILIDHGANPNLRDTTNGQTAAMFAAALGRGEAIKVLAEHGADLNAISRVTSVKALGGHGVPGEDDSKKTTKMGGNTALHFASREGQIEAVRELVAAGADVNKVSGSDHLSPLLQAIITGHFDIAKFLLEHSADPNIASTTAGLFPLWATIDARYAYREWYPAPSVEQEKTEYLELIRELIDRGANVNARLGAKPWFRTFGNSAGPDPAGSTVFWRAAQANDIIAMKLLLSRGADPNISTTHGCSPLLVASGLQHSYQGANMVPEARLDTVKFLVEELGANVNAKDDKGYSILHGAALIGRNDIIQYLVKKGADVTARASQISGSGDGGGEAIPAEPGQGDTVADMANGWSMNTPQYPETVTLLIQLGSQFSDRCWASTCVNPTRPDKELKRKP
jgi:ankyrin repeat protein